MGIIDLNLELTEDEYAFLRLQSIKLNTSLPGYVKRLIQEDRKQKKPNFPPKPESA